MPFRDSISAYTAAQIIAALGCPRATAYTWLDGSRKPPQWQQDLFLAIIARESKRHNKASHATATRRESGSAKRER